MSPLTPFDYTVLAVVGVSVLVSLFRGAVREVMSILSWIGAFMIALHYAPGLSRGRKRGQEKNGSDCDCERSRCHS